ncbi:MULTISPECIES: alkaline phosphatase [unclassified Colwellia]|jgi:alkaline phosphatase|uniref:alkaline phosphatase n=1 Tax=unclassified Colwellia TaxID=196834 RepID=UPI0015F70D7E|nr:MULTISPECIES: alkaline phosphatase [unclassified Colwellia]MBA6338584.1 alkaline phosphatase [Colwellia sp. BRX8-7]MBA6346545.1 alkaline phosphatase [Colwellia sp. BRX8-9]MBA6353378.1 alkaline phosphatase [Colwellia sp. BRX9-1]MBA6378938.1 alkaline phosphatase [Colwellia sp. BRX10-7]MBA6386647.1 alkaline phosphatase [Colwellia sp. BRX10-2]
MKKLLSAVSIILALTACQTIDNDSTAMLLNTETAKNIPSPKNIIMVIADGMGPAYTTSYRYFNDDPTTDIVEETVFDRLLVGSASTYPASVSGVVTDSAAGATALATGYKTYNGAIALDVNKNSVETVLEFARKQGKKTGVVVTSQINHATPAGYLTHNESRNNYNAIADSYIDNGIKADVYFGGGWKYFIREDRNLIEEFKASGFQYIDNYNALNTLKADMPVIGLFDDTGLPSALDDSDPYRLSAMTKVAIKQLENSKGYFMLVEASQVDWAGHSNDIATAMAEMSDLAKTMEYLEEYVKQNPDTLVILTADHSTGGLTVGARGKYEWHPEVLRTMKSSPSTIAKQLANSQITQQELSKLLNFDVTNNEVEQIEAAKIFAVEEIATYKSLDEQEKLKTKEPTMNNIISSAIKNIIDIRTNTGWTSGGHTAIDVPLHTLGKSSEVLKGKVDNTDVAKQIFLLLGKK